MAITVGSKAPDFSLKRKTADGLVDVKLSENFGKKNTVLLFFPLAFTGVCTQEMCDVTQGIEAYKSLNAEVYAISVDSPFSQEAWAQKEKITIPILSDLNKKVAADYGVLLADLIGLGSVSARAAFVISPDGTIKYSEQCPTPKDLPDFEKIKAALKS
jgi:glutaredoxin-dependent peroxiredoxin